MNNSILLDVKKILGLPPEYEAFDQDIIIHINSVLMALWQMNIGTEGFMIEGTNETWSDFLEEERQQELSAIKSYVSLKVRTLFDPPTSGAIAEAINANLKELEWRIYITENY